LLHSGDISDQVAKLFEIAPKFDVFGPPFFLGGGDFGEGEGPQMSDPILLIWVTIDHVAKFGDDGPSDLGD